MGAGVGFKLVQLLPINETGGDNSPYNAISAMAIEPTTLHLAAGSPEELRQEDFEEISAQFNLEKLRSGRVKYKEVRRLKRALLEKAFLRFRSAVDRGRGEAFEAFCETGTGVARRLRVLPRAHGGERRERSVGSLAGRTSLGRWSSRLVARTIRFGAGTVCGAGTVFPIRPMDRI